jgi:hypothetical protein
MIPYCCWCHLQDLCSTLWCKVGNSCQSKLEPAADGTKCGEDQVTTYYNYVSFLFLKIVEKDRPLLWSWGYTLHGFVDMFLDKPYGHTTSSIRFITIWISAFWSRNHWCCSYFTVFPLISLYYCCCRSCVTVESASNKLICLRESMVVGVLGATGASVHGHVVVGCPSRRDTAIIPGTIV